MKKPIIIFILLAVLTLSLAACGAQPAPTLTAADYLDLGEKYLLDLDYDQALVQFLKVIEIEPMNPRGYTGAAEAYVGLDRFDDAIAILEQGLTVLPDNAELQDRLTELDSQSASPMEDDLEPESLDELTEEPPETIDPTPTQEPAQSQEPATESAPNMEPNQEPVPVPIPEPEPESKSEQNVITKGETIEFGGYEWRVLDVQNDKALLLSEAIIEKRVYHNTFMDLTWESCDLRKYLNGDFYNKFSVDDRERIATTQVINNNNPWFGTNGGNSTNDKIFLLSLEEVVRYFGDSGQLQNRLGTDNWFSDEYSNNRIAYYNGNACGWWLRSPGLFSGYAASVYDSGNVGVNGYDCDIVVVINGGVRPALWLNL